MDTAARSTVDQKTSVWVPRNAVMIQLQGDDKKEEKKDEKKDPFENMGKSSDVALQAGRAVSLDVVAAQEGF